MLMANTDELVTIIDFIRYGISQANAQPLFYGHGTDNSEDDIFSLILSSLNLSVDCHPSFLQSRLTSTEKQHLIEQLKRRIVDQMPVPYLIKQANFCGLNFYVDERVLIPRSPIAELINQQFSPWIEADDVSHILDLCTGSGCIAIACCYAFPEAEVDAVDLSESALTVAEINRQRFDLSQQLNLIQSDCWQKVRKIQYDIIVANPPYVSDTEMQTLPAEYHHEPAMALRADNNGLALVEKIITNAHHYLTEQGILVVEVGNSEEALIEAYPDLPFVWLEFEQGGQGVFLLTAPQLRDYFGKKGKQ